eukprot:TRINITY_DN4034_c0_g1_i1.p2 TRINITY_DN4034_c0_g1~~TRINITY_DN4034_c0_g1_i1.p2  ORF type:complete len:235 (-),score=148.64 TRINITY_DN4034_c0_g1_i1:135-839(-)
MSGKSAKTAKPVTKAAKPAKVAAPAKTAPAKTTTKAAKPAAKPAVPLTKEQKLANRAQKKVARSEKKATKAAKKTSAPKKEIGSGKKVAKETAAKVAKATKVAKVIQRGVRTIGKQKIHTSVHFKRPKTLRLTRQPKYPRRSAPRRTKLDKYRILKHPLTTESAMKRIEDNNTLVFIVDVLTNKHQIVNAVKQMYQITPTKVRTLIRPDGQKKAFVKLPYNVDGLDVANKIGII